MTGLLAGRLGIYAAAALAVLALIASIYWMGGREARREAGDLRDYISTDERMDHAGEDIGAGDDSHVLDWLRRYGQ